MKTMTKRIASMALAVMMALVMLTGALPAKAYAAGETGTLAITSKNAEFNGKQVTAWQMFSATATADGSNASYTLNKGWVPFFKSLDEMKDVPEEQLSQKAVDYVTKLGASDSDNVIDFAKKASNWAKGQQLAATATATAIASGNNYVATFTGLPFGYYVVSPQAGSTDVTAPIRGTDAILANVVKDTQNVDLKSEYPTVDKKVETDKDHVSGEIGKKLTFTLKSTVPDVSECTKYRFAFKDELSKGLTFGEFVSVKIANQDVSKDDYVAESDQPNPEGKTALSVKFGAEDGDDRDAKALFNGKAGQEIVVTYTAFINADAVVGQAIPNKATVDYSTNPDGTGDGTSVPSVTNQYDFGFKLKKTDGENNLAGAQFELRHEATGNAIDLVQVNDGVYRLALEGDNGKVTTVTTGDTGIIEFRGLAAGDYYLVETQAPDGFNKLDKPVKITIADTTTNGATPSWTVKANDAVNEIQGGAGNVPEITVVNNKGSLLPSTGGMGTIAFTVIGAAVVVGGVAWAVRRKNAQR